MMHPARQDKKWNGSSPWAPYQHLWRGGRLSRFDNACLLPRRSWTWLTAAFLIMAAANPARLWSVPRDVTISQSASWVEAYDFVEVSLNVSSPDAANPCTDVSVQGQFGKAGDSSRTPVDGFCDSPDGSVFRIRFMPSTHTIIEVRTI